MCLKRSYGCKAVNGVTGKTADRLGKYQIYLTGKSIGYHFVEAVTLFGVRSRDAFIGINLLENPVLRLCPICGQAFVCKGKGSRRKYCGSPECNKRRVAQNVQNHRKKEKNRRTTDEGRGSRIKKIAPNEKKTLYRCLFFFSKLRKY